MERTEKEGEFAKTTECSIYSEMVYGKVKENTGKMGKEINE